MLFLHKFVNNVEKPFSAIEVRTQLDRVSQPWGPRSGCPGATSRSLF